MVSLRFTQGAGNMMMIEIQNMLRTELENKDYKVNGERVRANLKVNPQKNPLSTAQAVFYKSVRGAMRDKSKIMSIWVRHKCLSVRW